MPNGSSLAQVAENHSELGIFIEEAAAHQTKRVHRSFEPESPGCAGEARVSFVSLLARGREPCTVARIEMPFRTVENSR